MGLSFTNLAVVMLAGAVAGYFSAIWGQFLASNPLTCRRCGEKFSLRLRLRTLLPRCSTCHSRHVRLPLLMALVTSLIFAGFGWALCNLQCQTVNEVRPSFALWQNRLPFHLMFLFLLITATITDVLDYLIPDHIVLPGILLALFAATGSGELQLIHIWVDWDYELAALYGPWLPEWMSAHQHLHGFCWSLAGAAIGSGLIWAGRAAGQRILGVPALGFGDVTLMAMIGAFMGWQPTLCVLAIAPLVGLVFGFSIRILTGRSFVAFGPYLCAAAFVVLLSWRFLWESLQLRLIFSHWPTVVGMVAGAFAGYCLLLFALTLFRAVPAEQLRR
jgi:leader peptidase (prepilin peptidase)/N-methyltransferase